MPERIDNMVMNSAGQGGRRRRRRAELDDGGFVLVALLVGMAVGAIWLGAALPAWRHQALREKEAELIFRGEQYARAIVLYQKKNQGLYPQSIDTLLSDRHLRKKWKDPVTGKDFFPLGIGQQSAQPGPGAPSRGVPGGAPVQQTPGAPRGAGPPQPQGGAASAGITGVRSTSQATSIKIYKGQQQHSLWPFDANQLYQKMGYSPARGGGPGRGGPGRGGPGRQGTGTDPGRGGPIGIGPGRGRGDQPVPGRGRGGAPGPGPGRGAGS